MKTYNSFSLRRVGLLVKRDVVENWKVLLYRCLLWTAVLLWILYNGAKSFERTESYVELYNRYVCDVVESLDTIVLFLFFLSASYVMTHMTTKEGRTNLLMLPARDDEKFIARSLFMVGYPLLTFLVSVLLADVIRMYLFPLLGYYQGEFEVLRQSLIPGLWEMEEYCVSFHRRWGEWGGVFVLSMIVFAHSCYILGGNFWRKYPFIKTSGLLLLLFVGIYSTMYVFPPESAPAWYDTLMRSYYDEFILVCSVPFFVWAILNWYWAYRVFRLSEVVERKRRFLL